MSPNIKYFMEALTSDKITKMSGGRIPKMSPKQAAGLIGSWIVETGSQDLSNLDVVEEVAGAGRGLSQYTGARRTAYDIERQKALAAGQDVSSPEWQLQYFADEYAGKHDRHAGGKSLIGWTRAFENAPDLPTAEDYAEYYTGSAAAGKGYFRPGVPHADRRRSTAANIYQQYGQAPQTPPQSPTGLGTPPPVAQPPQAPQVPVQAPTSNADVVTGNPDAQPINPMEMIQGVVKQLGIPGFGG